MFKVGQKVWCVVYGEGVVEEIHQESTSYTVSVRFKDTLGNIFSVNYTADGRVYAGGNITLFPYPVEVVKVAVKPSIDWSHVSSEYNYLAMDSNGDGYLCGKEPPRLTTLWDMESPFVRASTFTSYVPGTCDWADSLVKRPE